MFSFNFLRFIQISCAFQYIAKKILKINERKRWLDPPPSDEVKRAIQDEEIFQIAKLVK